MIHTRDQLREAACELGLSEVADSITNLALDSLRTRTKSVEDEEIAIGASKFGGLPDLPPNVVWPDYINRERGKVRGRRESLGFLAQFNMAELAHHAPEGILPRTGMLYFFCAIWECAIGGDAKGNGGAWRVLYDNSDPTALIRTLPPRPLPENQRDDICGAHAYPFAASRLLFHRELTLPSLNNDLPSCVFLRDNEKDAYWDLTYVGTTPRRKRSATPPDGTRTTSAVCLRSVGRWRASAFPNEHRTTRQPAGRYLLAGGRMWVLLYTACRP